MRIIIGNGYTRGLYRSSPLKNLVKTTIIFSLICAIADQLNVSFFNFSLTNLFLLNNLAISNFFIWQPITSIFLLQIGQLSIGMLFDLLTPIYFLWTFGKALEPLLGKRGFFFLYFITGLVAALSSLIVMFYTGEYRIISCTTSAVLGLCTVWAMSFSYHSSPMLFLMPFSGQIILLLALLGTVGAELLQSNLPAAAAFFSAFLVSYCLGVFYWGFQGPIKALWSFESFIKRNFRIIRSRLKWRFQVLTVNIRRFFSGKD